MANQTRYLNRSPAEYSGNRSPMAFTFARIHGNKRSGPGYTMEPINTGPCDRWTTFAGFFERCLLSFRTSWYHHVQERNVQTVAGGFNRTALLINSLYECGKEIYSAGYLHPLFPFGRIFGNIVGNSCWK